ncbi:pheromone-regulated membrane protein [Metarhizium acridum CQMa 102]|uniref:Pheromone-regulated membrane protein n=1 Tax=Metarhizium acridum (strain CQMa 102) TaxID=655827 RepID=E9DYH4_METAQ|nr:pheromone-regulated membrane protein [Metarhizium acridum CQMa 102]EFY91244.1 pheromone-regulated membrane protein [Metarhizium acridum CQMa 102]
MGCASNRKKQTREFLDQKWDYINLQDFKAKGCGPGFAYGYLWFMLIISIAVYAVDSFTAVNLLAFDQWSSKIEPAIPFKVSKWIFSICILLSFVNLAFEGVRAFRVMRRGNVAECFLDSLAVRWESIRFGSGQGWRRFLVFAELTKSKKGSEYVALFTYFSFKSWIRVIFCSGPRQVVNALTLRSVYVAKLAPTATSVDGAILGFFDKVKVLASEDYQQAVILSGMCFTFVVWVFSALFLLMAVFFYVFFLFHWIPRADGGLSGYCERKVNKKLLRIVTTKVNKALAKGQADRFKAELELAKKNGEKVPYLDRAATLPTLPNVQPGTDDGLPRMPTLGQDEKTTMVQMYASSLGSPGSIELSSIDGRRPMQRTGTSGSGSSYSSRAPLVSSAADMAYGPSQTPATGLPDFDLVSGMGPPARPGTSNSQRSFSNGRPGYGHVANGSTGTPLRTISASPALTDRSLPGHPGLMRTQTNGSMSSSYGARPPTSRGNADPMGFETSSLPYSQYNPYDGFGGREMPAPSYGNSSGLFPPVRSVTGPAGPIRPQQEGAQYYPPQRNMTSPMPLRGYADGQAQGMPPGYRVEAYGYDVESQQNRGYY